MYNFVNRIVETLDHYRSMVFEIIRQYIFVKSYKKWAKSLFLARVGNTIIYVIWTQDLYCEMTFLQIAFTFLVYPALILGYMGQAAYLSKHHQMTHDISYYVSVPGNLLTFIFKYLSNLCR